MMLVGSMQPMPLDFVRMDRRFSQPGVKQALSEVGIPSLPALLSTWVTDRNGLVAFAGDAPPVTDDKPSIEYGSWTRPYTFEAVLPAIMRFAAEPSIKAMTTDARTEMESQRNLLYAFYKAGLAAYAQDRETWQLNGTYVMSRAADNPYYASAFAGTLQQ
jgi:spermidine synthase